MFISYCRQLQKSRYILLVINSVGSTDKKVANKILETPGICSCVIVSPTPAFYGEFESLMKYLFGCFSLQTKRFLNLGAVYVLCE